MVDGKFGRRRIVGMLLGEDDERRDLTENPWHGLLAHIGKPFCEKLVRALEDDGYIQVGEGEYPCLELSEKGWNVVNRKQVMDLHLLGEEEKTPKRQRSRSYGRKSNYGRRKD